MSGWSADNPDDARPATTGWNDAPPIEPPAAWAMPEAPTEVALDRGAPAGTDPMVHGTSQADEAHRWDASPERPAPPTLPVPLAAMTFTDIVDGAWGIIKARPRTVFAIIAMILLPTEIAAAWLTQGGSSFFDLSSSVVDSNLSGAPVLGGWGVILAAMLQNLSLFFLGGAIARLVSSWYAGGDMSARAAVGASLRRAPALIGAFAVLVPVKLAALATCGLALPFVVPLLLVTAPAIVIEDLGPIAGPLRSLRLTRRRYWPCVGVLALSLIIELTVNLALSVVPTLIAAMAPGPLAPAVAAAGTVFSAFVTAPFVVGVCVLLYLDLRVRTEGLDLELDATDAFARAA